MGTNVMVRYYHCIMALNRTLSALCSVDVDHLFELQLQFMEQQAVSAFQCPSADHACNEILRVCYMHSRLL